MKFDRLIHRLAYLATMLATVAIAMGFILWGLGDLHWALSLLIILPAAFFGVFAGLVFYATDKHKKEC